MPQHGQSAIVAYAIIASNYKWPVGGLTMTTAGAKVSPASAAAETPWYDLIPEVPEPPEDGMQQDDTITLVKSILMARYADDPRVLIAGPSTNLVYDSQRPGSFVVPDCYVVFGVDTQTIRRDRRLYRIDEWGATPAFVLEVASESTAARDMNEKREIYARMGASEYWRFDVTGGDYYGEPLVGERLVNGEYLRYELHTDADGTLWASSEVLGIDFCWQLEDGFGSFFMRDSSTGERLNQLADERAARLDAEARIQELRSELERLRAQRG